MSKFDDIFSRKAKEAFDNYNADHLAGDGWDSFASKYGRQRRRALVIPLWARAASIIILVTTGVLLINRLIDRQGGEPDDLTAQQGRSEMTDSIQAKSDTNTVKPAITASVPVSTESEKGSRAMVARAGQTSDPGSRAGRTGDTGSLTRQARETGSLAGQTRATGSRTEQTRNTGSLAGQTRESVIAGDQTPQNEFTGPVLTESVKPDGIYAGVNLAANPIEIRLTDEADSRLNLPPKKDLNDYLVLPRERMTTTIMTGFSGMMASVDNATTTARGVSIGFYVERQLTRRISVRPGLAMARHNYGMEGTPERILAGGNIAFDYAAPELNGLSGTTSSYEADIDVVSMEVPVNFVFSVWKRAEKNLFVSTGASTMIYLSQHMTGSFNNTYTKTTTNSYGGVSLETMTTTVQVEREHELMNRVDFLGLANFSAGYSMPFGKGTHMLFEPFVQLPVKDLTSMNLRIRYGGLSMKIQF